MTEQEPLPETPDEVTDNPRVTRYRRLGGLTEALSDQIAIAGVGAIGRQVALTLASMGCQHLALFDPDKVEEANFGPQGYPELSLGIQKVVAMRTDIRRINSTCQITPVFGKFPEMADRDYPTLFICIDNMEGRNEIASKTDPITHSRIIDTRLGGLAGRLITGHSLDDFETWRASLHTDEEAFDAPCSLRLTTYGAQILAGFAVAEYMALLQGRNPIDLHLDIMTRAIFPTSQVAEDLGVESVH
jgi:sulfur carrier protein ThiS adenylyltransferase